MPGVFQNMLNNVDSALGTLYTTASAGMSGYVMPVAWVVFGISVLVWGYMVMAGRAVFDITSGFMSIIFITIVLYMASGGYQTVIAQPLYAMPEQLAAALSGGGSPQAILDDLFVKMLNMLSGLGKAMIDQASDWAFGAAMITFLAMIAVGLICALLLGGALFVLLYAKIGLSLILAVGPFFIVWLAWQPTRQQFYPWLNTALYLVFLYVLTHLFITLFIGIVDHFMNNVTSVIGGADPDTIAGAVAGVANTFGLNVLVVVMQLVVISVPLFFILLQLPVIAQSLTAAGAGSFGSGATGLYNSLRGGGGTASGGGAGGGKGG